MVDAAILPYTRRELTPTFLTAYALDPDDQENADDDEKKQEQDHNKELVLVILVVFNVLLLLTLIFLYIIPVHRSRNCYGNSK